MTRIVVNGTSLLGPLTGIGQYTHHLVQELQRHPQWEVLLFNSKHFAPQVQTGDLLRGNVHLRRLLRQLPHAYALSRALQQRHFSRAQRQHRCALYHEPNFLAYAFDGPSIITVHDLSWIRYPETHPPERVHAMNRYFEPGLRRAALVLTDSEFVRAEVIATFGLAATQVRAVPLGADTLFQPRSTHALAKPLAPLGLAPQAYFLCVGTLEPRKNLRTALSAFSSLPLAVQDRMPLVLAGMRGWESSQFHAQLRPLVASGRVRQLGYLPREQLAQVVAGARALVYPSLYEGFGLPPLEAMACGVPVIVSDASSLPEVVGEAGTVVPALDEDALRQAMLRHAEDAAFCAAMGARGLQRAAGFSWATCAAATAQAYTDVLNTAR